MTNLRLFLGYLEFPASQQGNILTNYSSGDHLVNIARVVLSFVIVCHYPPSNYCCRYKDRKRKKKNEKERKNINILSFFLERH